MSAHFLGWMTKACGPIDEVRHASLTKAASATRKFTKHQSLKFVANFFAPLPQEDFAEVLALLRAHDPLLGSADSGASKDVRFLVGGALEHAIEAREFDNATTLAMGLVAGSLCGHRTGDFPQDIVEYANRSLPAIRAGCMERRSRMLSEAKLLEHISGLAQKAADIATLAAATTDVLKKLQNDNFERIADLDLRLKATEEEREYLWRAITRFSNIANCRYEDLSIDAEPIAAGIDYAVAGPCPVPHISARMLLAHSLAMRTDSGKVPNTSLKKAVNGLADTTKLQIVRDFDVHSAGYAFPVLRAVGSAVASASKAAWPKGYKREGNIDADSALPRADLAFQVLMEARLYHHAISATGAK